MKKNAMKMLLATIVMIGTVSISTTSVQGMENFTSFDWDVDVWEDLARTSYESEVFKEYKEEKNALKAKRQEEEKIVPEEVPVAEEVMADVAPTEVIPEVAPEVIVVAPEEVAPKEVVQEAPIDMAAHYANVSNEFINKLNAERAKLGLPALQNDAVLKANAEERAKELVNDYSHNGSIYGECISMISIKPRANDFLRNFMGSPLHWEALTGVLPAIGVGIYEGNGNSYIAVELDGASSSPIGTELTASTDTSRPSEWYDSDEAISDTLATSEPDIDWGGKGNGRDYPVQ